MVTRLLGDCGCSNRPTSHDAGGGSSFPRLVAPSVHLAEGEAISPSLTSQRVLCQTPLFFRLIGGVWH